MKNISLFFKVYIHLFTDISVYVAKFEFHGFILVVSTQIPFIYCFTVMCHISSQTNFFLDYTAKKKKGIWMVGNLLSKISKVKRVRTGFFCGFFYISFLFYMCVLVVCCFCALTLLEAPRCCQYPCRNSVQYQMSFSADN